MTRESPLWIRLAIVLLTIVLALAARLTYDINRTADPETGAWVSLEADSFYHMRRVERVVEEGWPVAGRDPMLDYPDGAEIPWPPYYTVLLGAIASPWLSEDVAVRRVEIEHFVASITVLFGVLAALLAAWSAWLLAGETGGAFAGACGALALCGVVYSSIGNGDHHAFVSFLHAGLLALLTWMLARGGFDSRAHGARLGVFLGAIAGLGLGSWVAFLPYIVEVDLVLAVLLFVHTRRSLPGLASFGFAFHASALVFLSYAALTSPWLDVDPWMVVNLSYFHLFFLALGAAVFVPLLSSRVEERLRPRYPWLVLAGLVVIGLAIAAIDAGPARGLRGAFAWASGEDEFMASIQESRSFFSSMGEGWRQLLLSLGYGIFLLPFAWGAAVIACWRGHSALLPWIVATPLLSLQALSQLRFAEALVVPLAVLVGWGVARVAEKFTGPSNPQRLFALAGAALFGVALQQPGIAEGLNYRAASSRAFEGTELQASLGATRRMCDWLRGIEAREGREGVLATWGHGHMIEWVAGRPTVATNFGSYLGAASYASPPQAFLCEEDDELERLLDERRIGHILISSRMTEMLPNMIARADPELLDDFLAGPVGAWKGALQPRWFRTTMARLLLGGSTVTERVPPVARRPFGFLRLVHVARELDPSPPLHGLVSQSARGWIWERVDGALLVANGEPGAEFSVRFEVNYPRANFRLFYADSVQLDSEGLGTLRVPYATDGRNGGGRVLPGARYSVAGKHGQLSITEEMVLSGATVSLP